MVSPPVKNVTLCTLIQSKDKVCPHGANQMKMHAREGVTSYQGPLQEVT